MNKLLRNPVVKYFLEAKEELQKVTWPTQKETRRYSIIITIFCIVVAIYFGAADFIFQRGLELLLNLAK